MTPGHLGGRFSGCDTTPAPFPASRSLPSLDEWVGRPYIFRGLFSQGSGGRLHNERAMAEGEGGALEH